MEPDEQRMIYLFKDIWGHIFTFLPREQVIICKRVNSTFYKIARDISSNKNQCFPRDLDINKNNISSRDIPNYAVNIGSVSLLRMYGIYMWSAVYDYMWISSIKGYGDIMSYLLNLPIYIDYTRLRKYMEITVSRGHIEIARILYYRANVRLEELYLILSLYHKQKNMTKWLIDHKCPLTFSNIYFIERHADHDIFLLICEKYKFIPPTRLNY